MSRPLQGKVVNCLISLTHCCRVFKLFACGVLCRSVAEPQRDLGAQASPSHMRSPDPRVAAQSLVDDTRMATLPPAADARGRFHHRL
jgi:hypothetical protein